MTINMPVGAKAIINALQNAGFHAYVVGGCVRDSLLGKEPHDWDICTNAIPSEVKACLRAYEIIDTGLKHGTVTVLGRDGSYEVTTFRTESGYSDHRRPDQVSFVSSLEQDLSRRDFTINAMAYNDDVGIIDLFGGQGDLLAGAIRCVGNPDDRFHEDALRILRAIRFASTYNFAIAEDTDTSIKKNANLLSYVAQERITAELLKTIVGAGAAEMLIEYKDIFSQLIPELKPCICFQQNNPYHQYDVYDHIAHSVGEYHGGDPVVALALLLHDVGKPLCYSENETGGHFHGHAKISHEMSKDILPRLKVDNITRHDVLELVLFHDLVTEVSAKFAKKWLNKISEKQFRRLLQVRRADILAQSEIGLVERLAKCYAVEQMIDQVLEEKQPFSLKDLAVNGNDIMDLGLTPGKEVGMILNWLLEEVIDGRLENRHHDLKVAAENKIYGIQ